MFWKLVFTAAVVLLIAGRTPMLRHPLVRLLVPRSWAVVLDALPGRLVAPPRRRTGPTPDPGNPPRPWLGPRARLALLAVVLAGLAAWTATRFLIVREANVAAETSTP